MEAITLTAILVALATFLYYIYIQGKPREGYPPGPWRLPIIGNGHQMMSDSYTAVFNWAKKFGPIFFVEAGPMKSVVLSETKIIKEAYAMEEFSGRPDFEVFRVLSGGKYGVAGTDGDVWREQRRFVLRQLRDMGFGKRSMEPLIMEEINEFIEWLKKEEGKPVDLNRKFKLAVLNSLWMLIHGKRYHHDDARLHAIFTTHEDTMQTVASAGVLFFIPKLPQMFPGISGWGKMWNMVNTFQNFFRESIEEHQATLGDEPRDFLDVYLQEMKNQANNKDSSFNEEHGLKNLLAVCGELFTAGYETTSVTLTWTFLYLSTHPHVLKKLQAEIDTVVGQSRQPNVADRPNMPYTEAVTSEVLRISSIVPIGILHRMTENTEFHNYKIPKDALVFQNLRYLHNNPDIWGDPKNFRPERFLSEDGKTYVRNENLMPFSTGKHACLGESLARDELFLFTTNICQRFDFSVDPANPNPNMNQIFGAIMSAHPYKVVMKDRLA